MGESVGGGGGEKEKSKCFPGEIAGLAAQKLISNITFGFTVIFTIIHSKCSMQASNFPLRREWGAKERGRTRWRAKRRKKMEKGEGGGEPNTHAHTHTHARTHARTRTHTHTHTHTHTKTLSHHRGMHEVKRGDRLLWLSASQMKFV